MERSAGPRWSKSRCQFLLFQSEREIHSNFSIASLFTQFLSRVKAQTLLEVERPKAASQHIFKLSTLTCITNIHSLGQPGWLRESCESRPYEIIQNQMTEDWRSPTPPLVREWEDLICNAGRIKTYPPSRNTSTATHQTHFKVLRHLNLIVEKVTFKYFLAALGTICLSFFCVCHEWSSSQ